MSVSPDVGMAIAQEVYKIYVEAEAKMLQKVNRRLERNIKTEGWNERKLQDVSDLRADLERTLSGLGKKAADDMDLAITNAYKLGNIQAGYDFEDARILFKDIDIPLSVQRIVTEAKIALTQSNVKILRTTMDAYRDIIAESTTGILVGTDTRRQAAQKALNKFANQGITGFTDRAGRNWDMSSYVEMATRSASGRAAIQGHIDRQVQEGRDLVVISDHPSECPLCRPYEGEILSISGNNPEYGALDTAVSNGLFHVNCRHSLTGYIPGLTKVEKGRPDPTGYDKTQQQRYNERQIRKWKRRESVAVTPADKAKSKAKIKEWQKINREFVKDNPSLVRKPYREQLAKAKPIQDSDIDLSNIVDIEVPKDPTKGLGKYTQLSDDQAWSISKQQKSKASKSQAKLLGPGDKGGQYFMAGKKSKAINNHLRGIKIDEKKERTIARLNNAIDDLGTNLPDMKVYRTVDANMFEVIAPNAGELSTYDKAAQKLYKQKSELKFAKEQIAKGTESEFFPKQVQKLEKSIPKLQKKVDSMLDDTLEVAQKRLSGIEFEEKGFMSVSYDRKKNIFDQRSYELEIFVDEGTKGLIANDFLDDDSESEILFAPGKKLQIIETVLDKNHVSSTGIENPRFIIKARMIEE